MQPPSLPCPNQTDQNDRNDRLRDKIIMVNHRPCCRNLAHMVVRCGYDITVALLVDGLYNLATTMGANLVTDSRMVFMLHINMFSLLRIERDFCVKIMFSIEFEGAYDDYLTSHLIQINPLINIFFVNRKSIQTCFVIRFYS